MICNKCGTENTSESKFCQHCGFPLTEAPAAETTPLYEQPAEPVAVEYSEPAPVYPQPEPQPIPQPVQQPISQPVQQQVPQQPSAPINKNPYSNTQQYNIPNQPVYPTPFPENQQAPANNKSFPGKGLSIAGMILGIASLAVLFTCSCCLIGPLGIIPTVLSVVGLILSIVGKVKSGKEIKNGFAIAGIICSAVGLVFSIILIISSAVGILSPEILNQFGIDVDDILGEFDFKTSIGL